MTDGQRLDAAYNEINKVWREKREIEQKLKTKAEFSERLIDALVVADKRSATSRIHNP